MSNRSPKFGVLALLAVLSVLPALSEATTLFTAGRVFDENGNSSTASSHTGKARLEVWRWNIFDQEVCYPDNTTAAPIDAAAGNTVPAKFAAFNVGDLWFTPTYTAAAPGDTMVAVAETRPGVFGWTGPAYVYFDKH